MELFERRKAKVKKNWLPGLISWPVSNKETIIILGNPIVSLPQESNQQ